MSLRLSLYFAALFLFVGIHMPFWPVWLTSRGLSAVEIGTVLSLSAWMRAAVQPFVAHMADRRGERKRVICFCLFGVALLFWLFTLAQGFWQILAVSMLVSALVSSVMPLGENLTMLTVTAHRLNYGRIRLWGSLAFIGAATAGGFLLRGREESLILWLLLGLAALGALTALALPDTRPPPAQHRRAPFIDLLRDRRYVVFLASASLVQASHAAYYGFSTLHWRQAGISEDIIGILWAEGVLAEVVLFFYAAPLIGRFRAESLLVIAAAGGVVRWLVTGSTTALPVLFIVQTLHALSFAAAHLGAMHFLARAVPADKSATAQSLYSSIAMGGMMGLTMIVAGRLYAAVGGGAFYAMAAMCAASLLIGLLLPRIGGARAAG